MRGRQVLTVLTRQKASRTLSGRGRCLNLLVLLYALWRGLLRHPHHGRLSSALFSVCRNAILAIPVGRFDERELIALWCLVFILIRTGNCEPSPPQFAM